MRRNRVIAVAAGVLVVAAFASQRVGDGDPVPVPPPATGVAPPPVDGGTAEDGRTTGAYEALGMFVGGGTELDALEARERWLGRRIPLVQVSVRRLAGWSEWRTDIAGHLSAWGERETTIVLSLPMVVEERTGPRDTQDVGAGARGLYDANWRWLGAQLLAAGDALRAQGVDLSDRFVLRPGWEHNGTVYRHSSNPRANLAQGRREERSRPRTFAAYWRRAHDLVMRPLVAGGHDVRWEWNVARTGEVDDVEAAFPTGVSPVTGEPYADVVSLDVYDSNGTFNNHYPPQNASTRAETWDDIRTAEIGLDWLVRFADRHTGGRLGLGEWGLQQRVVGGVERGGLDNPAFVANMAAWLEEQAQAGRLQWHRYFDIDARDGNHRLSPGGRSRFPKAATEFKRLFGRAR